MLEVEELIDKNLCTHCREIHKENVPGLIHFFYFYISSFTCVRLLMEKNVESKKGERKSIKNERIISSVIGFFSVLFFSSSCRRRVPSSFFTQVFFTMLLILKVNLERNFSFMTFFFLLFNKQTKNKKRLFTSFELGTKKQKLKCLFIMLKI